MPVTDALVASIQQLVIGDIVRLDIILRLLECPICEWVDLDKTSFVNFNNIHVSSFAPLTSPSPRQDGIDLQLSIRSLCRLDLGDPVVELIVRFPEFLAIFLGKLFGSINSIGLVHVDVDKRILLAHPADQRESLGEVMQSIEKDKVDDLWPGYLEF